MEHYVTLFDSGFLPQGLALHRSLERWAGPYTLWIVCLDETTQRVIEQLGLPNIRVLPLASVETPELRAVKPGRSRAEYCWTLTPFTPRFVFDTDPSVTRVTYVDADLWLLRSPAPIFREFEASGMQVLISEHAYAAEYDQSATSGKYCVQFQTFTRDGGETVRRWWADRCIEWCYARFEDGKFGDQKYLDDWPERFSGDVHVLQHREWLLAPWNAARFPYSDALVYHFHGLRIQDGGLVSAGEDYALPPIVRSRVYEPYLDDLRQVVASLRSVGFTPPPQQKRLGFYNRLKVKLEDIYSQRWRLRIHRPWRL